MPGGSGGDCFAIKMRNFVEHVLHGEPTGAPAEHGLMVQKIPEQLEVLEVVPRNATGKIDKKGLRETYKDSQRPKR